MMTRRTIIASSILVAVALAAASATGETLYRYVDPNGRVVYSDHPPPPSAKDIQPKALPDNVIETDAMPFAVKEAAGRFPVTLYTFDCDVCRDAEKFLASRGVPFSAVNVSEKEGFERLKALTGKQSAPVLQIGDKQIAQGFNAARWQALLDEAGYPRNAPPLRAERAGATSAAEKAAAEKSAVEKTAAAPPAVDETPPGPGQGYPK